MPKFRINKKSRPEKPLHHFESQDFCISPRPPPSPPKSIDLQPFSRLRSSPHDSAHDLHERLNNWRIEVSDVQAESVSDHSRKTSMKKSPPPPIPSDVLVVGAGPSGLMLAGNLIRFGITTDIIDNRSERTATGRADGIQPRTLELLKQMHLADRLLTKGVKVNEIRLWKSTSGSSLKRITTQSYFGAKSLDCLDPYLLLAHQGFVEDLLLKDLLERGVDVQRNIRFVDCQKNTKTNQNIEVICKDEHSDEKHVFAASYVVGCDGAQSNVRKSIGARMVGSSYDQVWGVIDGELDTDFPDTYSKTVIHSEEAGACILIPRERGMTRMCVEIRPELRDVSHRLTEAMVMNIAQEIFEPYRIHWRRVAWFGRYQVGQKVASTFQDDDGRVFICGESTHTQSPNASQGMNTSINDAVNLAWKLNLAIRGLAKPSLLKTYEEERRHIAEHLMAFDQKHSSAFSSGDMQALSDDFSRSARFTSGFGADYPPNVLNVPQRCCFLGNLRAGSLPPPAKVTRHFDTNPVDIQTDRPYLGQFGVYFFAKEIEQSRDFLQVISEHALSHSSVLGKITSAANASYTLQPPLAAISDEFTRPERYTAVSGMFTFALVLQSNARDFELGQLPQLFQESRYTVYADDVPHLDTRNMTCTEKWLGPMAAYEVGVVVLRPDGYVGTVGRFNGRSKENGMRASKWLDEYFDGFLLSGF